MQYRTVDKFFSRLLIDRLLHSIENEEFTNAEEDHERRDIAERSNHM